MLNPINTQGITAGRRKHSKTSNVIRNVLHFKGYLIIILITYATSATPLAWRSACQNRALISEKYPWPV